MFDPATHADLVLDSEDRLATVLEGGRWLIFKHSTRCPISSHAFEEYDAWRARAGVDAPRTALCLVVEARAVSNAIAAKLGVRHESPQAILVDGGKVLWHASHHKITAEELARRGAAPTR
jgi:bacillithiol system protein YtxJ